MHSLLENYLAEVAAHLGALPTKQRTEELREMRAHLENVFAVNQEQGQSEDEAAQAALAQFGAPEAVGQETVIAWRRGESLRKRDFWGAAACALALIFLLSRLIGPIANASLSHSSPTSLHSLAVYLSWHYSIYVLAGAISGFVFPRRATAGTGLAVILSFAFVMVMLAYWWMAHASSHPTVSSPAFFVLSLAVQYTLNSLFALIAAWAFSRWRQVGLGRERLARD